MSSYVQVKSPCIQEQMATFSWDHREIGSFQQEAAKKIAIQHLMSRGDGAAIALQRDDRTYELFCKKDGKTQSFTVQFSESGIIHLDRSSTEAKTLEDILGEIGAEYLIGKQEISDRKKVRKLAHKDLKGQDIGTVIKYSRKNHPDIQYSYLAIKQSDGIHLYRYQHRSESKPGSPRSRSVEVKSGTERIWKGTESIRSASDPILVGKMKEGQEQTDHEAAIHRRFQSSQRLNTVMSYEASDGGNRFITTRLEGTLHQALDLTTKEKLQIFLKVCEGVQELHDAHVVHRDLKLDNVYLTLDKADPGNSRVEVGDFGLSTSYNAKENENDGIDAPTGELEQAGSPTYFDPRYFTAKIDSEEDAKAADIFSLGILLNYLEKGEEVDDFGFSLIMVGAGVDDDNKETKRQTFEELLKDKIPNDQVRALVSKMICFPELGEKRLTIGEVINEVRKIIDTISDGSTSVDSPV